MESGKVDESNFGHAKDEWRKQEDMTKIIIYAYDLKWNIDEKC